MLTEVRRTRFHATHATSPVCIYVLRNVHVYMYIPIYIHTHGYFCIHVCICNKWQVFRNKWKESVWHMTHSCIRDMIRVNIDFRDMTCMVVSVWCSVAQCVAVCCSHLTHSQLHVTWLHGQGAHCSTLQHRHCGATADWRCNTPHYTAQHCNTVQHTAIPCNTLQQTATATRCGTSSKWRCNTPHYTAQHCNTLQHTAIPCNTLRRVVAAALSGDATLCNVLQHTAPCCNTLHCTTTHTATQCNTLHHVLTLSRRLDCVAALPPNGDATHRNTPHHTTTHCTKQQDITTTQSSHAAWNTLRRYRWLPMQHSATHSTTLQRSTTLCNAQQHTTTHSNTSYGPPTTHETRCGATANWWCTLVLLQGPLVLLQRLLVLLYWRLQCELPALAVGCCCGVCMKLSNVTVYLTLINVALLFEGAQFARESSRNPVGVEPVLWKPSNIDPGSLISDTNRESNVVWSQWYKSNKRVYTGLKPHFHEVSWAGWRDACMMHASSYMWNVAVVCVWRLQVWRWCVYEDWTVSRQCMLLCMKLYVGCYCGVCMKIACFKTIHVAVVYPCTSCCYVVYVCSYM